MKKTLIFFMLFSIFYSCHVQKSAGYQLGDKIKIKLEKNGIGGYNWEFKENSYVNLLNEADSSYYNPETKLTEYDKIFLFQAAKVGDTTLMFIKKRGFEPDSLIPKDNFKKIKISITDTIQK